MRLAARGSSELGKKLPGKPWPPVVALYDAFTCLFSAAGLISAAHVLSLGRTEPGGNVLKWATGVGAGVGPDPVPLPPLPDERAPPPTHPPRSAQALIVRSARAKRWSGRRADRTTEVTFS